MQPQNKDGKLSQPERATHLAAARFALIPAHEFDALPVEAQAEQIALYLIDCRLREIQAWEQEEEMKAQATAGGRDDDD